jgi:hypothetical protein
LGGHVGKQRGPKLLFSLVLLCGNPMGLAGRLRFPVLISVNRKATIKNVGKRGGAKIQVLKLVSLLLHLYPVVP